MQQLPCSTTLNVLVLDPTCGPLRPCIVTTPHFKYKHWDAIIGSCFRGTFPGGPTPPGRLDLLQIGRVHFAYLEHTHDTKIYYLTLRSIYFVVQSNEGPVSFTTSNLNIRLMERTKRSICIFYSLPVPNTPFLQKSLYKYGGRVQKFCPAKT